MNTDEFSCELCSGSHQVGDSLRPRQAHAGGSCERTSASTAGGPSTSYVPPGGEAFPAVDCDDHFGFAGTSHDLPAPVPLEVQFYADASSALFSEERKCSRSGELISLDKVQQIVDENSFFETAVPTMSNAGQITRINSITCHGDL